MKKIGLKTLAIALSIISLLTVSPAKINAADDTNSNCVLYGSIGVAAVGVVLADIWCSCALGHALCCKCDKDLFKDLFKDHLENNKLTKRSEGYNWEWLACLQGLLKNRGIEKSQKDMYKGIAGKSPNLFECFRLNGLSFFEDLNEAKKLKSNYKGTGIRCDGTIGSCVYLGQVRNYVEKISNNKYTFKVEYIDADIDSVSDVCGKIKEIYIKNGKSPISTMDSMWRCKHATVNVVGIDDNDNVTIEEPYLELRRTEPLENFVSRYKFRNFTQTFKKNKIPGIPVTYVALKNNA